jgi:hypothetical protein
LNVKERVSAVLDASVEGIRNNIKRRFRIRASRIAVGISVIPATHRFLWTSQVCYNGFLRKRGRVKNNEKCSAIYRKRRRKKKKEDTSRHVPHCWVVHAIQKQNVKNKNKELSR